MQAARHLRGAIKASKDDPQAMRASLGALSQKGKTLVRKPAKVPGQQAAGVLKPQNMGPAAFVTNKENASANGQVLSK